jgi:hypothetical protein
MTILFLFTAIALFFAVSVLLFAANIAQAPSKSALRTGNLPVPAHNTYGIVLEGGGVRTLGFKIIIEFL